MKQSGTGIYKGPHAHPTGYTYSWALVKHIVIKLYYCNMVICLTPK